MKNPLLSILAASIIWGLSGLFYKALAHVPPLEVLAHRTLWSLLLFGIMLAFRGRLGAVPRPAGWFGNNWQDTTLLILTGPMTAGPLILFSYAAQKVRLSTVGLIQYLNPTLQFMVAALIFGEAFTIWHAIALPLIWAALALYYFETKRSEALKPARLR